MILFIFFLLSFNLYSFDSLILSKTDYNYLNEKLSLDLNDDDLGNINKRKSILENVLKDDDQIINKIFHLNDFYKSNVLFWLKVYTVYDTSQVVFHDKNNLDIIYKELDFSKIWVADINIFSKSNLQSYYVENFTSEIKNNLKELLILNDYNKLKKHPYFEILKNAGLILNKDLKKRKLEIKELLNNVRAQTGQRNKQRSGILKYQPYNDFFTYILKLFELPHELVGIPFLESSFNNKAHSKVGALGIWQIMPFIASKLMPNHKHIEYRLNPFISTVAALHLLKQNFKILKRWDLSITAYNSGTKHIINASRQLKIPLHELTLETLLTRYDHPHLGFASKNFYMEFLALVRVLEHRNKLFSLENLSNTKNIFFYMNKCKFKKSSLMETGLFEEKYNSHLESDRYLYPKGTILVSTKLIENNNFQLVEDNLILKATPNSWPKNLKSYNCSTK